LKQYNSIIGILFLNGSTLFVTSAETLELTKLLLHITLIVITIIYTLTKLYFLFKNRNNKVNED